jgi:ribonuclease P/MRP protein subunit RPP1
MMTVADACIHPYPEGNSSLRRMAVEARELGFDTIVVPDAVTLTCPGVRIIPASIIRAESVRTVSGRLSRYNDGKSLVMVEAGENGFNRAVLNIRGVHVLRALHLARKQSFDHICARIAAERGIAVDIDISPLIHTSGPSRQRVLVRFAELIRLHDRYRFFLTVSSNARSVLHLRSANDIVLLCSLFGMEEDDVCEALSTVGNLIAPEGPVRVVS